jgi:flagellar hook assembly protein FlgD
LPDPGVAEVRVFDVRGREVRTLLRAELEPGAHQVYWDGRDDGGRDVASGVYLAQVRLTSGGRHDQQVRKVLVTH